MQWCIAMRCDLTIEQYAMQGVLDAGEWNGGTAVGRNAVQAKRCGLSGW